jgi:hypothetical protein
MATPSNVFRSCRLTTATMMKLVVHVPVCQGSSRNNQLNPIAARSTALHAQMREATNVRYILSRGTVLTSKCMYVNVKKITTTTIQRLAVFALLS